MDGIDHHGQAALLVATRRGQASVVAELVARGADTNVYSSRGIHSQTALMLAAAGGRADIVDILVRVPGTDVDAFHSNESGDRGPLLRGPTALMHACWKGHTGVVARLLAAGARVDHADYLGGGSAMTNMTALSYACMRGAPEVVSLLLAAGANANQKSSHGASAVCARRHLPSSTRLSGSRWHA